MHTTEQRTVGLEALMTDHRKGKKKMLGEVEDDKTKGLKEVTDLRALESLCLREEKDVLAL